VARSLGLTPSVADALGTARQYGGWTAANGMGGAGGEVSMLEHMGVPVIAKYTPDGKYVPEPANQTAIDAELAAGRPVIIDTRGIPNTTAEAGHYFAIMGKTDQGYVVSGSGTALKNGSEVMTRQQMEQAMGGWQNMIRLDPSRLPQSAQGQPAPAPASAPAVAMTAPAQAAPGVRAAQKVSSEPDEPDNFGDYVRWSAASHGIDPDQVGAVMGREGPEGWTSVGRFNTGTSYGPLQLHYAGGSNPTAGMGDAFTKATGVDLRKVDPTTPEGVRAHKLAVDYAMSEILKDGDYHQWYGADSPLRDKLQLPNGRMTKVKRIQPVARRS